MGAMAPSASTLQRLAGSLHERWEGLGDGRGPRREDIPLEAVSASVSRRHGGAVRRRGWARRGLLARGRLRHGLFPRRRRRTAEDPLLRPHAGERQARAEGATLASEVAHIRQTRPDIAIIAVADGAPDNWTFLESLSSEAEAVDFWHGCEHLRTASDHAVDPRWFETYRHVLRHDQHGVAKVIRALRYLRDKAGKNRAARNAVERELAFFRKHRKRMRYRHLSDRRFAIGSGVVEAQTKYSSHSA